MAETHSKKTTDELVLKTRGSLKFAYTRVLITNDSGHLLARGQEQPNRNIALSITDFKKLRQSYLSHQDKEFNNIVLLALETETRRGELLGLTKADLFEYGTNIKRSISPTDNETKHSKRDTSISKDVYTALQKLVETKSTYLFDWN